MKQDITIGLVDDHQLFRQGIRSILEQVQHFQIVLEADNGQSYLDQLAVTVPDVVLLDLEMPVMDGLSALAITREAYPSLKTIILSMHQDDGLMAHLMERGANGYLLKDSTSHELVTAIESVLIQGFFFSEKLSKAMLNQLIQKTKLKPSLPAQMQLSEREIEVLQLICKEMTTTEIADTLFISPRTVEGHRNRLLEKTGAKNIAGLVIFAMKHALV
ncbi:MAG: response regulator transcription factor [Bacteroidia bacterium]|jgi:DNA-binding NarL/FixJ family response regulator|nr:response regulator transcription factor [Bacteroidia bacterium]